MNTSIQNLRLQWMQLLALAAMHFTVDVFAGMFHSVLPAIQSRFALDMRHGGIVLTCFLVVCNGIQLLTGHKRAEKTTPLFIYIGLVLTCSVGFIHLLPVQSGSFGAIIFLAVICACGIGITHPEGLRSIHTLSVIGSATSTSVFMAGGVAGFAVGGWAATIIVQQYGFEGLWLFAACSLVCGVAIWVLKIRMATEEKPKAAGEGAANAEKEPAFRAVMLMATLAAISSTIVVWILPQRLAQLGCRLSFGGLSVMFFSLAGGAGSFLWAAVSERKGKLRTVNAALLAGVPLLAAYVFFVHVKAAVVLLFAASFCSFGAYPIMVAIARSAKGFNLGGRMGFIVGGTWLVSSMFPMLFAGIAEKYGAQVVLTAAPLGYILSAAVGIYVHRRMKVKVNNVPARQEEDFEQFV